MDINVSITMRDRFVKSKGRYSRQEFLIERGGDVILPDALFADYMIDSLSAGKSVVVTKRNKAYKGFLEAFEDAAGNFDEGMPQIEKVVKKVAPAKIVEDLNASVAQLEADIAVLERLYGDDVQGLAEARNRLKLY